MKIILKIAKAEVILGIKVGNWSQKSKSQLGTYGQESMLDSNSELTSIIENVKSGKARNHE